MRAAALAVALALACEATPEPAPEVDAGPPWLEVGTGSDRWEELPEGVALAVVRGPQGGIHALARVRYRGLRGDVMAGFAIVDAATGARLTLDEPPRRRVPGRSLLPWDAGYESAFAELVIFADSDPTPLRGRRARLDVSVAERDRPERRVEVRRAVTLTAP